VAEIYAAVIGQTQHDECPYEGDTRPPCRNLARQRRNLANTQQSFTSHETWERKLKRVSNKRAPPTSLIISCDKYTKSCRETLSVDPKKVIPPELHTFISHDELNFALHGLSE